MRRSYLLSRNLHIVSTHWSNWSKSSSLPSQSIIWSCCVLRRTRNLRKWILLSRTNSTMWISQSLG